MARKKVMEQAEIAINKLCDEGRLVFINGGKARYIDKQGQEAMYIMDDLVAVLWDKMNSEIMKTQVGANLVILNIVPDDIKSIVITVSEERRLIGEIR